MRFWDDKDANGNKLTDGRICLVIKSDDHPDMPEIRTYGKDKDEVLDKVAKTAETAQGQIHRMRKTPASTIPPARPTSAPAAITTNGDLVTAVADLSNPQKAPQAIKTLLKAAGVDVDQQAQAQRLRNAAAIAEKWQNERSDYPADPRNDRIVMNIAARMAGGPGRITAEFLDAALEEAQRLELLHEPRVASPESREALATQDLGLGTRTTVQPGGSPDSRTVRNATSYRRGSLRSPEPAPAPRGDSAKEAKWRLILEKGTGKALEDAIRNQPGFSEWVDKQFAKTA
jgi:hypothetical protein